MGMSSHVVGLRDRAEHDKHLKVRDVCREANVSLPRETAEYFGEAGDGFKAEDFSEEEIEARLEVPLDCCTEKYCAEYRDGFDVVVDNIPSHVKIIRFYNSY